MNKEKLKIEERYLTKNRCYKAAKRRTEIGIQIHTIGTGQGTAQAVADYWNQASVSACVHYIVDCDEKWKVLQTLPESYYSWADGGYGNRNLITIEICESDYIRYTQGASYNVLNAEKFKEDIMRGYNTAVLLCAEICNRKKWDPEAVLASGLHLISSHDEGRRAGLSTAHVDPTHVWNRFGMNMDQFRKDVKTAMKEGTWTETEEKVYYRVRKTWENASSQFGAYEILETAIKNCPAGYAVYDETGKELYRNEKAAGGTQTSEFAGLSETQAANWLLEIARPIAEKYGMLPSALAGRAILESGFCTTYLAKNANNVCGMKSALLNATWTSPTWDGKSEITIVTTEYRNGVAMKVNDQFRKYDSIEACMEDHCAFFLNAKVSVTAEKPKYDGITECKNYREQMQLIKDRGYATDPEYVGKVCKIIEKYNLARYDAEQPKAEKDILSQCAKMEAQRATDTAAGHPWAYRNPSKYVEEKWADAVKNEKRACNCALLARWALKEAGLIPQKTGVFYGKKGGTIAWGKGTQEAVEKICDVIAGSGKTVDELLAAGKIIPGDIVTYVDIQHTNIYAGNGKWYDAGHAYCDGTGEGAIFRSWFGSGKYGKQKVGQIIRKKGATQAETEKPDQSEKKQYIVQAGAFTKKKNAEVLTARIKKKGFDAIVKKSGGNYIVQCGSFTEKKNAEALAKKLKRAGFSAIVK